jgi:hypothetical protein
MSPSPSHRGYCIQFLNGIPGTESSRNWTEFPEFRPIPELSDHHVTLTLTPWLLHPIPERNWVVTRWVRDDTIILEVVIPESSDHHVTLTLTPWLLHPIPERNSGN